MKIKLDPWQDEVKSCQGNVCLVSGRQVGKSTILSEDAGEWGVNNPNKTILMIASVERQAYGLFEKTLDYLYTHHRSKVKQGKDRPTKTQLKLTNGTRILCLPTGVDGHGIRFLTVHRLYGDEAAFIPEEVWTAVTPMLAITGGTQHLSSTPHGTEGYFYRMCHDKNFKVFHISTEEAVRKRKLCSSWTKLQRKMSLEHIEREKDRMTTLQFAQEYMGEFVSDLCQVFPDALIKACQTLNPNKRDAIYSAFDYYLGVDVAGMGEDESTFEVLEYKEGRLRHAHHETTAKTRTTETTERIVQLNKLYDFRKEYVDSGGLGVGVCDQLRLLDRHKKKIVEINNATRVFEVDSSGKENKEKRKILLKENLYNNLLALMERGEIKLLKGDDIFQSLKSVQFEIKDNRTIYFGNYTHIAEGLIRAAWCVQDKSLKVFLL